MSYNIFIAYIFFSVLIKNIPVFYYRYYHLITHSTAHVVYIKYIKKLSFICLLLVLDYEIQVYTGTVSDADAEANVYIHVFGTRGDSGKRKLHKSKFQTLKFQKGQVKYI